MPRYPYRDLGTGFDRNFRNALNANFDDIEADIKELGAGAQQALEAADEANTQAIYAQTSGDYANDKGDYAAQQGDYAKAQGDYAKAQANYTKQVGDENKTRWLTAVNTYADIATTYPNPRLGDTVQTIDDSKIYRWNGTQWVWTQQYNANAITDVQNKIGILNEYLADTARFINVKKYGAKGNGIDDDTNSINLAISDMTDGAILYFPKGTYIISSTLLIPYNNITIKGEYSYVKFPNGVDGVVFEFNNQININIDGVGSSNTTSAQTFIKATSTHHLHVTNANFDGMKLGFDLTGCYWTKLESLRFQSIYKCFEFKSATNAFHIANVSINGAGVPSTIYMCTSGGNITGCSFEGNSGRIKIDVSNGINIDGNYFEGYDEVNINEYISIGSANYKYTRGFNISGNLFYAGAKNGISLYNVDGINISGNYFGTTHAVELYSFDASNQSNISYTGNSYSGSTEFLITGKQNQASVSPEYKFPLIFKPSLLNPKTLGTNEIAIYNNSGLMKLKKESGEGNIVSSETIFNSTLATNTSITKNIDNGAGTFLLFVTTFIDNNTQKTGVYIIQGNINLRNHFYVITLSNNDLVEVTTTIGEKTITIKNVDTVSRFMNVKLVEFS